MGVPEHSNFLQPESLTFANQQVLFRLLEAHDVSTELRQDVWQFSLELEAFRADGFADTLLRRLVTEGFVSHAREVTRGRSKKRLMCKVSHLQFTPRSCF